MNISPDILIEAIVLILCGITFYGFAKIGVKRIARSVTTRPITYISACLMGVVLLGIGAKNLALEPDINKILPTDFPCRVVFQKIEHSFGGVDNAYICVSVKEGTIWDAHVLTQIRAISRALKRAAYTDKVMSITEAKYITNTNDVMTMADIMPEDGPLDAAAIRSIRTRAQANDMLYKRLVSADEKSTLIGVIVNLSLPVKEADGSIRHRKILDQEICERLVHDPDKPTLLNIQAKYADPRYSLIITGFPYFRYYGQVCMAQDMNLFLIMGIVVMLAFLYASFRTLRGMLLPLSIVSMALIASFGFMGWMKEVITQPFLLMGPMLIAIAHNYGTQLIAKYYEDVQEASPPFSRADIRLISGNCISSIGAPVMISAVTVIVGFVTMISHPIRALCLLGFFSAFGIIIAFILTIVLTPALLSLLPIPRLLIEKRHGSYTDKILKKFALYTVHHKGSILAGGLTLAALCAFYIPTIKVDANVMNSYPKYTAIYKDAEFVSQTFGGYSTLNLVLEATHPAADNAPEDGPMKTPAILKWMDDFQTYTLAQSDPKTGKKLVGDALSFVDFVGYMNRVMQNNPKAPTIPERADLIAQYLLSFENQSSGDFSSMVDFKYNNAQMIFRLPDMSAARLKVLTHAMRQYIKDHPNPDIKISFGGTVETVSEISDMIMDGQIWSLALSLIIIIVCYMFFFRSLAAGLLAAVPLFYAIMIVFGLMGFFHIALDPITATLTGISIGAGTDYTAYFLWRLRERSSLSQNLETGYIETMTTIGKGILYNGLSVVVGFVVFLFSNFLPIRFFGFLISFSILACILSTLTILPINVFLFKPRFLMQAATADHSSATDNPADAQVREASSVASE